MIAGRAMLTSRPCVAITTYARPDGLSLLLDDLEHEAPPQGLDVHVFDDATPNPDRALVARIASCGWSYRRATVNHGRRGWWRWWNVLLGDLRKTSAEHLYVLQDDIRLCRHFFERSAELWGSIDDPRKASLYLHVTRERGAPNTRCWTPVAASRSRRVLRCGWVDCAAVLAHRRLFDALDWRLEPISEGRWRRDERVSSGVGQQLSVRAHALGLGLYCAEHSLVVHDGSASQMNRAARARWPMDTVGFVDGEASAHALERPRPPVHAGLASIPERERGLRRVVEALLPQVDRLCVYLNGYDRVPTFLADERIVVATSREYGDRGDAGKFFWAADARGYHLLCDDDIAYPPDYVERLLAGIERHGRRAVVGFHGAVIREPCADYHSGRRLLHFARPLAADTPVHVLGTGVSGYHTAALSVTPEDFKAPNMADVWLALLGQSRGVPFVCLQRDGGWLAQQEGFLEQSIYVRARRAASAGKPTRETVAVREQGTWRLHGAKPAAVRPAPRPVRDPHTDTAPRAVPAIRVRVAGPRCHATLVLPAGDHITLVVQQSGTYYERDLLDAVQARVNGGVFVDVGAHYGNHTAFFGLECGAERIIAFEPSQPAYAGLLETVAENGLERVVEARRIAVHPAWRRVSLSEPPARAARGRAGAHGNSGRVRVEPTAAGPQAVPAAPLDQLLDGVPRVAMLKLDVEAFSLQVLGSGLGMVRRDRPLIAVAAAGPDARRRVRAMLAPLGYEEAGRFCRTPTWLWDPADGARPHA